MMQTGQGRSGMQTMNQSLYTLFTKGIIAMDDAIARSPVPEEMMTMISRAPQQGAAGQLRKP
jgi:twitching motility protein PilT